jgi:rod shape-determining protein MreC
MTNTPTNLGRAPVRYGSRLPRTARGNLVRLAGFLVASALLGYWQSHQPARFRPLQNGIVTLAAPLITVLSSVGHGLRDVSAGLPNSAKLAQENRRLRNQIAELDRGRTALKEAESEKARLEALLRLRSQTHRVSVAARVIGTRLSRWPETIMIDKGRAEGIRPRQAVLAPAGLVGRVYSVTAHTALVVPVTDCNSAMGATVQRSRYNGILSGDGEACRLKYLALEADVKVGDVVVSSGTGEIFPKGILIGSVIAVADDESASMKYAVVHPNVDLARLEEVLVLVK